MPLRSTLLAEIQHALGQAVSPSLTAQSDVSDVYEGYIFTILLRAARIEGADVFLSSRQGHTPGQFYFRTSPGYLKSERHNYGHAQLCFPRSPPLEVHVSVRVAGGSNVLHECDLSVIDTNEAETCRTNSQTLAPRSSRVRIAVEAKFYTTPLPLHLGRAFLGLVRDLSADNSFLVFNREAESIERLLAHKRQGWEHNVLPTNNIPVDRLTSAFQIAFKNYKAVLANRQTCSRLRTPPLCVAREEAGRTTD